MPVGRKELDQARGISMTLPYLTVREGSGEMVRLWKWISASEIYDVNNLRTRHL